jgi:hypothetical protein
MVRITADLLHFQSVPSASEKSIGGVDLIGAKVAAQASIRNAIMSKVRFTAVLLFPVCWRFFPDYRDALLAGVDFSLSSRAGKVASSNGPNCFVAAWPTKPLHEIATAIRDADWRDLDWHKREVPTRGEYFAFWPEAVMLLGQT